jgi:hypothetical protein
MNERARREKRANLSKFNNRVPRCYPVITTVYLSYIRYRILKTGKTQRIRRRGTTIDLMDRPVDTSQRQRIYIYISYYLLSSLHYSNISIHNHDEGSCFAACERAIRYGRVPVHEELEDAVSNWKSCPNRIQTVFLGGPCDPLDGCLLGRLPFSVGQSAYTPFSRRTYDPNQEAVADRFGDKSKWN